MRSRLVAEQADGLLLEEFVSTELESTLKEVASESWAGTGQQSSSTFICNDLTEAAHQPTVVGGRIQLDACLDPILSQVSLFVSLRAHTLAPISAILKASISLSRTLPLSPSAIGNNLHIDGRQTSVRNRAAHGTGESEARVQVDARKLFRLHGCFGGLFERIQADAASRDRRRLRTHLDDMVLGS